MLENCISWKNYFLLKRSFFIKKKHKKTTLNQSIWKGNTLLMAKYLVANFCTDGCITFTEGMILGASFSNVIFYICKCKRVPDYHLCMQMLDLPFAHQVQISFGHYPTDGQIKCVLHLFKATNPFKKVVSGFVYSQQHSSAEVNRVTPTPFCEEIFFFLIACSNTLFSMDLVSSGEALCCRNQEGFEINIRMGLPLQEAWQEGNMLGPY